MADGGNFKPETKIQRYRKLNQALESEQSSFHDQWRDLRDHVKPRRLRLTKDDKNRGNKRNQKIVDMTAPLAARTMQSGMHAGITSPARPWFNVLTADPDLNLYAKVKRWLHAVTGVLRNIYLRSNVYNSFPLLYGDQGVFGVGAMIAVRDAKDVIRTYVPPVGSYRMALNDRNVVDTFIRDVPMTVRQVVRAFGDPMAGPDSRWKPFSIHVKNLWDQNNLDADIPVAHVITANADYDYSKSVSTSKRYASCYFEDATGTGYTSNDREQFLSESGFDTFPVFVGRWEASLGDVYGTDCPGMTALGDIKALQLMQKRKAEAVEKMVRPPMTAPTAMRNTKASILPGDVTYLDVREGQQGFKPVYEVRPQVSELTADIKEHQQRVSRAFYEDLFLMLAMLDRREITAREIDERHEEKLIMLGPTLERENDEILDPFTDWAFSIAYEDGLLPPIPDEILRARVPLRVEYISIMAQAQRMIGLGGLRNFSGYVTSLTGVFRSAGDKMNTDRAIDAYGEMTGVDPNVIRSDDETAAIRRERAAREQAAAQDAAKAQAAENLATLSKASLEEKSVLSEMAGEEGETV